MKKIVSTGLLLFFVVTFLIGNNVTQASASFDGITNSVNDFKVETDNGDTGGVSSISNSLSIDKEQGLI